MRKDIMERMIIMKNEEIKPNFAELARRYNCDYRTIKKHYYNAVNNVEPTTINKPSKLNDYKETINEKLDLGCSAKSIYEFIKKKGFNGGYGIVKLYCKSYKSERVNKATIRYETSPGLQAQVDWKEKKTLISKNGEIFEINIFLIIMGYSRYKYLELTLDKSQDTVFRCLTHAFNYFGGVPKEILFDNMKTIVDHSRSDYNNAVLNEKVYEYSKNAGFKAKLCRAYRPQTKGKVENLAKVMDRLDVYNNEFETFDDLVKLVDELNNDLNKEICQATNEKPIERFEKEKEYLNQLPSIDILKCFYEKPVTRKVSKDSMVVYNRSKYSVDPKYIGKTLTVEPKENTLYIYYNKNLIRKHTITNNYINYVNEDAVNILQADVFKNQSVDEIQKFIDNNITIYDQIGETQ